MRKDIINDLAALARAGYTKEDIQKLIGPVDAKKPAEQVKPEPQPVAEPAEKPVDPVLAAIEKLTGKIESMNIQASEMPEEESVDSILAMILSPDGGK